MAPMKMENGSRWLSYRCFCLQGRFRGVRRAHGAFPLILNKGWPMQFNNSMEAIMNFLQ